MVIGKSSYASAVRKYAVRNEIIPRHKFNTIVGLPGPNSRVYTGDMLSRGFTNQFLYEIDKSRYLKQISALSKLKNVNIELYNKDILTADVLPNVFYDIDLCCSVSKAEEHIRKFRENCTFTFSMQDRHAKKPDHINRFFSIREEQLTETPLVISPYIQQYRTTGGVYKLHSYRDGAPMLTITKIK